jgi:tRNA threonylcarbamoyl adenosine modification protein YeaZ
MELSIDTSTEFAGIALSRGGKTLAELMWRSGQNHSKELLPNINHLLSQSSTAGESIDAVFVAIGPGSFNGIRVGISTAKGLALSLQIPILGISSLEIEAFPFSYTGLPICPIHSAGRNEIATALFKQNARWTRIKQEHITTVDTLCQQTKERTLFCGELPDETVGTIKNSLKELAVIPGPTTRLRRAGYLASLGFMRLENNDRDNPASLQPLYLRPPSITKRKVK